MPPLWDDDSLIFEGFDSKLREPLLDPSSRGNRSHGQFVRLLTPSLRGPLIVGHRRVPCEGSVPSAFSGTALLADLRADRVCQESEGAVSPCEKDCREHDRWR